MSAIALDKEAVGDALKQQAGKEPATYYNAPKEPSWSRKLAFGVTALVLGSVAIGAIGQAYNQAVIQPQARAAQTEAAHQASSFGTVDMDLTYAISDVKDSRDWAQKTIEALPDVQVSGYQSEDMANLEVYKDTSFQISKELITNAKQLDRAIEDAGRLIERLEAKMEKHPVAKSQDSFFSFNSEAEVVQFGTMNNMVAKLQEKMDLAKTERASLGEEIGHFRHYSTALGKLQSGIESNPNGFLEKVNATQPGAEAVQSIQSDSVIVNNLLDKLGPEQVKELRDNLMHDQYQQSANQSFYRQSM